MSFIYIAVCIAFIFLDQITKLIALVKLKPVHNITVVEGFLDFTFVENRGAAFGILNGQRWFFVILTIAIAIAIVIAFFKMPETKEYKFVRWALILILSGAIGNAIDRIIRGYVVDFFEFTFIHYPVFNVADIFIVIGTILMAVLVIFFMKDDETNDIEKEE